jgi:hypothetical protein
MVVGLVEADSTVAVAADANTEAVLIQKRCERFE